MRFLRVLMPLLLTLSGCQKNTDGPQGELSDCDPLDPSICALPFPSQHFLKEDPTTVTGYRVNFGETSLPVNYDGTPTRPTYFNEHDGFSINTPALFYFEGLTLDGVNDVNHIEDYALDTAKTVIVNTTTRERLPHWIEMDGTAPADIVRLTLLRPAKPMEWNTQYVVGIRGLKTVSGDDVKISPAFKALRDGTPTDNPDIELMRQHYEDVVFPALEAQGFVRSELQLAWDFHTISRESMLGRMDLILTDALGWVDSNGFTYAFDTVTDRDCSVEGEHIARDIEGHFTAPLYTLADSPEDPNNGDDVKEALLTRDADGNPFQNGTTSVEFTARIPCSVAHGMDGNGAVATSAPIVQYGHGLLGSRGEVNSGYLADMADRDGFILYAQDWTGFMEDDVNGVTFMIVQDPTYFNIIPERSMQGMMEQVLGMRMMITSMVEDEKFTFDGAKVIDPSQPYYDGNSQGAIMGSALVAMSPDIKRGVYGVGGGPYSLLLPRSHDFEPFFLLFKQRYEDHRDIMLFVAGLTQQLWDPAEGAGWVWDMSRDADQPKQTLQQVAIYDNQVTTRGAQYVARAYGAVTLAPANRPIFGVEEVEAGAEGTNANVLVEWKYTDLPDEPDHVEAPGANPPPPFDDGRHLDPHECPRRQPQAQAQLWHFLTTGKVIQTCEGGPCTDTVANVCN